MKLLILACGAGSGQAAAAKALKDEAERQGHAAEIVDPFSRLGRKKPEGDAPAGERKKRRSALSRKMERITDATPLTAPFLFSGAKFAESFGEEIRSGGFGAILAIHPYAMEAVSALIRHGEKLPPARGVFTDYALPPLFRGTELREYFLPHWVLTEDLAERGIRRDRLNACGVPAPARLASPMGKDEARNYLVLPREEKILLLFAEGLSEGNAARILDELLPARGTGAFVTVMTGRESGDRDDLAARYARDSRVQVNLFTERFDVYLAACDVLIARPDGFFASAAALAGIPTVLLPAVPGTTEAKNADFFASREMALKAQTARDAAHKAERLLSDRAQRERMEAVQRRGWIRAAAEEIVREAAAE